jgi:hypothetical protein
MDGATSLGTASLTNGTASLSTTSLATGTHNITASYGGNTVDGASSSKGVTVQVNAAQFATTTTLNASPATTTSGQMVALSANVSPSSGSSVPGGTITFQDGATSLGSVTLAMGKATLNVNTLSVGSHTLSAVYGGDASDLASTSNSLPLTVTAASASAAGDAPTKGGGSLDFWSVVGLGGLLVPRFARKGREFSRWSLRGGEASRKHY